MGWLQTQFIVNKEIITVCKILRLQTIMMWIRASLIPRIKIPLVVENSDGGHTYITWSQGSPHPRVQMCIGYTVLQHMAIVRLLFKMLKVSRSKVNLSGGKATKDHGNLQQRRAKLHPCHGATHVYMDSGALSTQINLDDYNVTKSILCGLFILTMQVLLTWRYYSWW